MPILDENGRPKSVRTEDEELEDLEAAFEAMTPEEREAFLAVLSDLEQGDADAFEQLVEAEYEREIVGPEQFLLDDYYLGAVGNSMWPELQKDFVELFEGGYSEAILTGSLGWGKSFFATCGICYVAYQMSCMANPQQVYGLAPGSTLAIAILSATREAARRVPLSEIGAKIQLSPYFKENAPFKIAQTMYEIRFPTKKMMIVAGSTSSAAIGTNVFAGFIDEMAFMGEKRQFDRSGRLVQVDKSEVLTNAIVRRMKSRFQRSGKLPGLMFLVSSKERPVAFIEEKIKEAINGDSTDVFVRDYATWDVKPKDTFTGETFQVAVGNDRVRAKLDPSEDEAVWYMDQGLRVIEVPTDYRADFESNLEESLRDIAGIATEAVSPYVNRIEKIAEAVDEALPLPLDTDEWVAGTELEIRWDRIAVPFERKLPGGFTEQAWRPLRHPEAVRYVHLDPALTGDAAGVAISHIANWTEVIRRDANGEELVELAPVIETDLLLAVVPPPADEIFLGDLRSIVYQFQQHGFQIVYGSMDLYQSVDTKQQFVKRGMEAEILSVDKTMLPYDCLKSALYEDRVRMQDCPVVVRELQQLQRVPKPRAKGFKIDHPKKGRDGKPGTKDVADALAGVVYSLTQRMPGRPMPIITSSRHQEGEKVDHSWVTEGRVMVQTQSDGAPKRSKTSIDGMPMPFVR